MGEELKKENVEGYGDKLLGDQDGFLFKLEGNAYTLDKKFDVIDGNAFEGVDFKEIFEGKQNKVINFNNVKLIRKGAFESVVYNDAELEVYFDSDEEIEIEEGAFDAFKMKMMSGFDSKKVSLTLYKGSFDNDFYGSLQELKNLSLYLEGNDWKDKDIETLQSKITENVTIFKGGKEVKNEKVSDEISDTEEKEAKTEEKVEIEKEVKTEEGTKVEENKYKAWGEIENKTKNEMIDFVISKLVKDKFRIRADIDIDKAIEADGEIKLPKECFVDIKLVSAGGGIVEVLKLLSKPGSNEENILLIDDVDNRKLAKDAIKEYIKGHWDEIIEKRIERDVKIVKGNIEKKIKNEGARRKFLYNNNASKKSSVSVYLRNISRWDIEDLSEEEIKNIIKSVSIIAKENKKEDKELYNLCKKCVECMRQAITE